MVINRSHSEHVANRDRKENHLSKIKQYMSDEIDGNIRNGTDDVGTTGDNAIQSIATQAISKGLTDSGAFIRKKFDIVRRDKKDDSAGIDKLKEMVKNKTTGGIGNSDDLDYLLWKDEAKELAMSVNFAQMLNFRGVNKDLSVMITTMLESDGNHSQSIKFSQNIEYSMYRPEEIVVSLVPSALTKDGPRGDMVKLVNQNSHAVGLSESIAAKAVGVEMNLMSGKSATKMNAIRNKPVDMRQMALKAVMIKLQLTLAYALEESEVEFETIELKHQIDKKTTTDALKGYPSKDIIIDVAKLSCEQRDILLALCSRWPSQRLKSGSGYDIYSAVTIDEENFDLYSSQELEGEILFNGLLMTPRVFWVQCVQLFMNLGGLDDLVEVVRDTRGLAPILIHNTRTFGRQMSLISAYPMSSCYYGINTRSALNRKYLAPTILESSTLVLLLDNMMLSIYLNNIVYMGENLGLGSKSLFPTVSGDHNTKVMDVLTCYHLLSGLPSCELMSLACPWLSSVGRFHTSGVKVLMDMVNRIRNREKHPLVCCTLNYKVPTKMRVSSAMLIRCEQEVDVSKIMGFQSSVDATGPTIQLVNWYNAISGDSLPCYGPSAQGAKLRGNELRMLRKLHEYSGMFKIVRIIAVTDYEPQKTGEGTLKHTFFQKPGYMEAEAPVKSLAKPIDYKANSFSIKSVAPEGRDAPGDMSEIGAMMNTMIASVSEITEELKRSRRKSMEIQDQLPTTKGNVRSKNSDNATEAMRIEGVPKNGLWEMRDIPDTLLVQVPSKTKPGNCGIEALAASIPGMDLEEGLGTLGVSLDDGCWLTADELAKIADSYDMNLLVIKDKGMPEMYCKSDGGDRAYAVVHQSDNHFSAAAPVRGKGNIKPVVVISVEPAPKTPMGKQTMRRSIIRGQAGRDVIPRNLNQ